MVYSDREIVEIDLTNERFGIVRLTIYDLSGRALINQRIVVY